MNKEVFFLQNLAKLFHQLPEDEVCAKNVHRLKSSIGPIHGRWKKQKKRHAEPFKFKTYTKEVPGNWKSEYKDEIPK